MICSLLCYLLLSPISNFLPDLDTNIDQIIGIDQPLKVAELEPDDALQEPNYPTQPTFNFSGDFVREINIVGESNAFTNEIEKIVSAYEGRVLTREEQFRLRDNITLFYIQQGYITSRSADPEFSDGILTIRVIEGVLEGVDVEALDSGRTINPRTVRYIQDTIIAGIHQPLQTQQLEEQLRQLKLNPRFEALQFSLRRGSSEGQSVIQVSVRERNTLRFSVGFNNYSPPSVGSNRLTTGIYLNDLFTYQDQLVYETEIEPSNSSDSSRQPLMGLVYNTSPLNQSNATLQTRIEIRNNEVIQAPLDEFGLRSNSSLYEIIYRQPLIDKSYEEFALSLGFTLQDSQTFIFGDKPIAFSNGANEDGETRTSVITFGQEYIYRDRLGRWQWLLRSQFSFGTSFLGATQNFDSTPDGQFINWLGQVQHLHRLSRDSTLVIQGDMQFAFDSLLPSQQFTIGGAESLRGYRENVRSGDNGLRLSIENRITIWGNRTNTHRLQLAPFLDTGVVWNNNNNANPSFDQNFLASVGLGVLYQPFPGLNMRLDYGLPLIGISRNGDSLQDNGLHFGIGYEF